MQRAGADFSRYRYAPGNDTRQRDTDLMKEWEVRTRSACSSGSATGTHSGAKLDSMASVWLGAISSLSGVIVGAIATYLSQKGIWKRTTRRELYGDLVGRSIICHEQLLDVAFAIGRHMENDELNARWQKANVGMAEVSSSAAQVSMVATTGTRAAAKALAANLSNLKDELYRHNKNKTEPASGREYRATFNLVQDNFIEAASKELRITSTERA